MNQFDFTRAHSELVTPLFNALHPGTRWLLDRVSTEACDIGQEKDLSLPYPETDLKWAFEFFANEYGEDALSDAAQIVYWYGHLGARDCFQRHGTYWKFAMYADQELRRRFQVADRENNKRIWLWIRQGVLGLSYSTSHEHSNVDLGRANAETVRLARELLGAKLEDPSPDFGNRQTGRNRDNERFEQDLKSVKYALRRAGLLLAGPLEKFSTMAQDFTTARAL